MDKAAPDERKWTKEWKLPEWPSVFTLDDIKGCILAASRCVSRFNSRTLVPMAKTSEWEIKGLHATAAFRPSICVILDMVSTDYNSVWFWQSVCVCVCACVQLCVWLPTVFSRRYASLVAPAPGMKRCMEGNSKCQYETSFLRVCTRNLIRIVFPICTLHFYFH